MSTHQALSWIIAMVKYSKENDVRLSHISSSKNVLQFFLQLIQPYH